MTDFRIREQNLVNLLTNTGFQVWSNSGLGQGTTGRQTDYEVSVIRNDDCEDDATGYYYKSNCTLAFTSDPGNGAGGSDGYYTITEASTIQRITYTLSGLTVGKLYKFSLFVKNGTYTLTSSDLLRAIPNGSSTAIESTPLADSATWTEFSVIWKATETDNRVEIYLNMGSGPVTLYLYSAVAGKMETVAGYQPVDNNESFIVSRDDTFVNVSLYISAVEVI